jgi:hypothetical protein
MYCGFAQGISAVVVVVVGIVVDSVTRGVVDMFGNTTVNIALCGVVDMLVNMTVQRVGTGIGNMVVDMVVDVVGGMV